MGEVNRVEINAPTETENITLEQEAAMKDAAANEEAGGTTTQPEATGEETEPQGDRPEWLDDKFGSAEELAKAYSELEKKQSESKAEAETTNEDGEAEELNAVSKATLEFSEKGELSDETFKALEGVGLNKDYVEAYIAGQEALADVQAAKVQESVGGREEYSNMTAWAAENLSEGEVATFNNLLETGTPEQQNLAIKGLYAQYVGDAGSGPSLKQGSTSGNAIKPFSSTAELQRAMSDQRYTDVPAYRDEVEKRLSVSSIL